MYIVNSFKGKSYQPSSQKVEAKFTPLKKNLPNTINPFLNNLSQIKIVVKFGSISDDLRQLRRSKQVIGSLKTK